MYCMFDPVSQSMLRTGIGNRDKSFTLVNHRMMTGKKNPKIPEMAGGNTPETKANENSLASNHDCKKGT